jgi:hypothetical protein
MPTGVPKFYKMSIVLTGIWGCPESGSPWIKTQLRAIGLHAKQKSPDKNLGPDSKGCTQTGGPWIKEGLRATRRSLDKNLGPCNSS